MAHIHDKIDFTASVYIVHDNKILLHKHKLLHIWLAPGGHVELDEDPNETALREAKEETGLDAQLVGEAHSYDSPFNARELIPPKFLNRHFFDQSHTHEHVDLCYFARPISDISNARPELENGELRWFTKEELEKNDFGIVPDVRAHALAALKELSS
ncbi:MAG TPA: NUDIX domain-containing protein [Candidatus Paceibacterota bacterium]|jgi:8-oxo-dGTP pyrophosphatase MutT (NUDIX family)|nr:NUDIX domain-containing protein [Candidatus Paceibacterota bacterium]